MLTEQGAVLEHETPRANGALYAAILGQFVVLGLLMGGQGVIWADVQTALRIGDGVFGTVQLASPAIAVVLLLLGGALSARFGNRVLAIVSMTFLVCSQIAMMRMVGAAGFVGALLLGGAGNGLLETAMNAETMEWEHSAGTAHMNFMHAGFSAGAVFGAMGGGAILGYALSFRVILVALMIFCCMLAISIACVPFPRRKSRPDSGSTWSTIRLILHDGNLRLLAVLAVLGVVGESVGFVWSVIYLRDLGAPPLLSGASFALFNGAMLTGRLSNASIVTRHGFRFSLAISGATLILATTLLLSSHSVPVATIGFILTGLGVAGVVPTVLSRASQLAPDMSGAVSGGIMAAAYIGFIVCPPAIGWISQATSLRVALACVGVTGVLMLLLLTWFRKPSASHPRL
jgi:MFS family permease